MEPVHDKISLGQLPSNQRELAEIVGMEKYVELTRRFGGDTIYVQKYTELLKTPRNAEIKAKFNGYNFGELAKEYDLSERYIRNLVSDITVQVRSRPMDGQVSFGDLSLGI